MDAFQGTKSQDEAEGGRGEYDRVDRAAKPESDEGNRRCQKKKQRWWVGAIQERWDGEKREEQSNGPGDNAAGAVEFDVNEQDAEG